MPAAKSTSKSPSFYASVVFLKIQDFARRPATEQARLRAQLQAVVAVTAEIPPAGRVMLDAADGAAIVVLDDPRAALRLAERALTAVAVGLPLSAGLNHGALQLAAGRKNGEGMTGDGIAVAASVAAFAGASRILASRTFRDAMAESAPGREAVLAPAGTFNDPGLRAHELFTPNHRALGRRGRRYSAIAVLLAACLIGTGIGVRSATPSQQPFMEAVLERTEPYWRELVQRVSY
jgi:class 3 adenylate cyclase